MGLVRVNPIFVAAAAGMALSVQAAAQGNPDPIAQTHTLVDPRPTRSPKPELVPLSTALYITPGGAVPFVQLGPVNPDQVLAEDGQAAARGDKRIRYGVGRDIGMGMEQGRWDEVRGGGGRLWTGDLIATGALGVRVHLTGLKLPAGAQLVVYSPADPGRVVGPYEGTGPFEDGQVWTPTRAGERIRIECFVPGLGPGQLPATDLFRIDRVQHIYRDPTGLASRDVCHNDVTCYPAWANTAKACAGIGTIGLDSLFCSGQMLNTVTGDLTPYYLTANQCVGDYQTARTAEVYFNFRTPACDGSPPPLTSVPQSAVCTLVYTNPASDCTLLMVEGAIPQGIAWAGWTSAPVLDGTPAACIHFPQGTYERISFGNKAANPTCAGVDNLRVDWTSGPTEPGSVGGGVFTDDANQQLFGQLDCGPSACGNVTSDDFGSFSVSYPGLASYLNAGWDDGFEPNDSCAAARAMVAGTYPGLIVKSTSEDWYSIAVVPGATASVQLAFSHANGDIDLQMFAFCGGPVIAASASQSNAESISWTNSTGSAQTVFFRVYLASDTRNTYTMTVVTGPPVNSGACCLPSGMCTVASPSTCASWAGVYAGDATLCTGACASYSYVGSAVPIPDGSGTSGCGTAAIAQVNVPDSYPVAALSAGVYITHSYQGDLKFSLRHVTTGTTVSLVDRPGVPQTTFGFATDNYGASPANLFYSLGGANQVYDVPATTGIDNPTGAWKPEGMLSALVGQDSSGAWQLVAQDCAASATGLIVAFRLTLARAITLSPCYPNCDLSTTAPVLNANDFQCFLNAFAAGDSYANCDGSTVAPILNANDFQCFLNQFAGGCS